MSVAVPGSPSKGKTSANKEVVDVKHSIIEGQFVSGQVGLASAMATSSSSRQLSRVAKLTGSVGAAGSGASASTLGPIAGTTVWQPYSPANSRPSSPTHSRNASPENSKPNSPRDRFESSSSSTAPGIRRSNSSDFNGKLAVGESGSTRPKQTSPRSMHPSGAHTARGLSTSRAFEEYSEAYALSPDAIPPSTLSKSSISPGRGSGSKDLPRPHRDSSSTQSGTVPSSSSPNLISTTPHKYSSSQPGSPGGFHSPRSAISSPATPRSPGSPAVGPVPTPPPLPSKNWTPSGPHSLSNSPAANGDVKAMLKDLKKKEKEEKKAKKKEEKEEKKAAKEAKKKSKHQATGSTGSNSGSTSPSPSTTTSPFEAKRATSPGKDSPPSPARSASPARHGGSLSAPGSSGSSQLHVTTSPNNMVTLTTTTPVHPNVNTNLFNTSPAPSSPTAVPARDFTSSPMSLLQKLAAAEEHGAAPLSPLRTMAPEVAPKISLADFRVIKLIGKGGFGEVYLVEHIEKQKKMALKVLAKSAILNQTKMQQVLNERAVLVKSFKSPFLLSLNYSFQDQKHLYFAMKYCPGGDLRALLSAIGAFEEDEARLYMAEMIVSVDALHRLGYIHRDLKPDNFLIDAQGHLVLADFGLSKELYESTRASKRISGASSAKLPVSSAIAHVRDRSLSTIQSPPPAHGKSPSVLLGPQDLVSLNAMNVESRFVRRKRRNPASDMSSSFNPMTHSYNPSGTDPFGGSSLPRDSDGFGTGSFIPGSARNSTLFDSDSPMGGSYNPMLASFGAQPVRPVIQFADLPSKAQQRRLMAYSVVGSPDYMSPEVLAEHGYGAEVDWWSVGCLCFELVLGIPPFTGQSIQEVFDNIANWETRLPQILEQYQAYLSPTCFDLLSQLLCDPKKRLGQNGISEIKKHPFFEGLDWDRLRDEEPPFVPRLENEEDTSYFEANVINKQQAFIPTQGVPSPLPSTTPAANPNDYYRQFSYNEADLAPHLKQQPPF